VAAAEDALSEAFASALTNWPLTGCPKSPEAWLLTVARRKMIDVAGDGAAVKWRQRSCRSLPRLDAAAADVANDLEVPDQRWR